MKINCSHRFAAALLTAAFTPSAMLPSPAAKSRQRTMPEAVPGRELATEVREKLAARLPDNIDTIRVDARGPEIVLSGDVDMLAKRHIAGAVAESVPGVVRVANHLTVTPERRADDQIAVQVKSAVEFDPTLAKQKIDVSVEDAVVTLRGSVDSVPQKRLAAWIATGQRGVRDVRNDIRVTPATRLDAEIRAELAELYARSPLFNDEALTVHVRDGAVVLTGTVDSIWEKQRAESDAWRDGVLHVDVSGLQVSKASQSAPGPLRSPAEIVRDIRAAAATNAALANNDLEPEIKDGRAVLTGEVDSFYEKWVAEDLVKHVPGVQRVENRLRIKGVEFAERAEHYHQPAGWQHTPTVATPGRSIEETDAEIKAAVERALAADPRLFGKQIKVSVQQGVVTLRARFDTILQQTAAVDIAREAGARLVRQEFEIDVPR